MAKAVIFDFDGVLVDSESHWSREQQRLYARIVPDWKPEYLAGMKGLSVHDEHAHLVSEHGLNMPHDEYEEALEAFAGDLYGVHVTLIDGMRELVERLHRGNVPLAIASSSNRSWIDAALERFGMKDLFDVVCTGEDVKGKGKPHPDIYLLAAAHLGATPSECTVVEDSPTGILAGKAAGMRVIAMRTDAYAEADLEHADSIASDAAELSALLA
jgi:16S rRNA pseudouridine516 synthase